MKTTILGAGNIGMALAEGLVESGAAKKGDITLTKRNQKALEALQIQGYHTTQSNREAVKDADTVFICVLPQQLNELLEEIKPSIERPNFNTTLESLDSRKVQLKPARSH